MDELPVTFCVTVPATFSDRAKNNLRETAYQAGSASREGDSLRLITEPEAAMLATMNSVRGSGVGVGISVVISHEI